MLKDERLELLVEVETMSDEMVKALLDVVRILKEKHPENFV